MTKIDIGVRLCEALNMDEEVKYIEKEGRKAIRVHEGVVVLFPTHREILSFINKLLVLNDKLEYSGIKLDDQLNYIYQIVVFPYSMLVMGMAHLLIIIELLL